MPAPASTDHDSRRYEGLAWSHELDLASCWPRSARSQPGDAGDEPAAARKPPRWRPRPMRGRRRGM